MAARSYAHLVELLLLLAFSKVSVFIAGQCERKGERTLFLSVFNGIRSNVDGVLGDKSMESRGQGNVGCGCGQ